MNIFSHKKNNGFSLVELVVSVAIFTIITSVILARHSQFSGTLLLENLAYDIALSIRKAQVFGLSVKEFTTGSSQFDIGYGVHLDSSDDTSYIFLADLDGDEAYSGVEEIIETFTLRKGNFISEFCGILSSGIEKCSDSDITYLDIIFERPNPEAIIKSSIPSDVYTSARVTVSSPQGVTWNVTTVITGQISIHR
jgi:prepilin-type N-terminal cleavage/methylation domain-containing protein